MAMMEVYVMIGVLTLVVTAAYAGMWAMFEKAGQPGWAAVVPVYNLIVLHKTAGKPAWWVVFNFVCPPVYTILLILVVVALAERFGKGALYIIGLLFVPVVFVLLLGFGDARYKPVNA
jgi:hypothetical protein